MSKATSLQQRMEIQSRAAAGTSDAQIAAELQLSPATVRKWRRRGQRQGRAGLVSTLGRPPRGALSSFSAEVRAAIRALRTAHPGWGPLTLRAELARQPQYQGQRWPQRSQIAAFLHEMGVTRSYQRRTELTQPPAPTILQAHQVWELAAQGVQVVKDLGKLVLIDMLDCYSRVKVESWACLGSTKANTDD